MIKLCHSHHTILQIIPHCWYILQQCTRRRRNSFEAVFLHGATFFKYLTVLGYLFQYLILGFPGSFPLFGAKNKTQSQLSCRLNFSLNCSLVFPILSALCTLFPRASSLSCHFCIPSFPTNFITS